MGLQAPLLCLLPSCSRQAEPALQDLGWVCGSLSQLGFGGRALEGLFLEYGPGGGGGLYGIRASVCSVSVFLLSKEGGQRATAPQRNECLPLPERSGWLSSRRGIQKRL